MESDAESPQPFIFSLQSLNHVNLVQHLLTHTCKLVRTDGHKIANFSIVKASVTNKVT